MMDPLDAIMAVMNEAFDPAYGEAWTRTQVSQSLILPNTHYRLSLAESGAATLEKVRGFTLSRHVADEEELLLIAVRPEFRKMGVGFALMREFCADARQRGVRKLCLEMREGNAVEKLYRRMGFACVGRRKAYYRKGRDGPFDALTFTRILTP